MYHTTQYAIDQSHPLFSYLDERSHAANNLHNTALYRIRQIFIGAGKTELKDSQKEVMSKIAAYLPTMNKTRAHYSKEIRHKKAIVKLNFYLTN